MSGKKGTWFLLGLAATAYAAAPLPALAESVLAEDVGTSVDLWFDDAAALTNPALAPLPGADVDLDAHDTASPIALQNPAGLSTTSPASAAAIADSAVAPAQVSQPGALLNLPPPRSARTPAVARRPASTLARGAALGTLASVPYMIGDTGAGTCIGFDGLLDARLSHPALACGRLNIAENNSPLPADRLYVSYRHFENSSPISVFQFREDYNIDRWTLASERTFWGGLASWELRLPIAYQVKNDIISIFDDVSGAADLVADPNRETSLGNLSLITKFLLLEGRDYAVSAGLGVTLPTAHDVRYRLGFRGEVLYTDFPDFSVDSLTVIDAQFDNETVYLMPFVSWLYAPRQSRWFHHGFLQVEAAANPSTVTAEALGLNTFLYQGWPIGIFDYTTNGPVDVELHAQTLMRLNLGTGYELARNPRATFVQRLVGLAELHYTTTLQDAKLSEFPIDTSGAGLVLADFQELKVGNRSNRSDMLNAALGLQADMGPLIVTNGFVVPLRDRPDRGFDFEYSLQVQLPY